VENFDLLSTVQPSEGWFAIVGIKGESVKQSFVETREEADAVSAQYLNQQRNVFFGVAKYKTGVGRTKENVQALRALWLDIDCGEAKAQINEKTKRPGGYIDQGAGYEALKNFCKLTGMPQPTLVSSGRGIHAYWTLDRDVTRQEWEPVATRLRDLCYSHDFHADPAVFEVARILRVPGTLNFKDDPPKPVEVMFVGEVVSFDWVIQTLGVKHVAAQPQWEPSALGMAMKKSVDFSFSKIMRRSEKGDGCNQLLHAYNNRATIDYYEWFHAISVAAMCEDAGEAVHMLSEGHPDYDPVTVENKVATIRGATSCSKFEGKNPQLCEGCKWKGQIMGPKYLGRKVLEAKSNKVEELVDTPDGPRAETFIIPPYPFPFFRGEGGGIWKKPPKGDTGEEVEPTLVYPNDVYIIKRMKDQKNGEVLVFRRHLPLDGVADFSVPLNEVTSKDLLRKALSTNSVAIHPKKFDMFIDYLMLMLDQAQNTEIMKDMRNQFGWADNGSKFIIGEQEISKDGILYSPPSQVTATLAKHMGAYGDLAAWKEVWSLYGRPGLEGHAFAALSAFGAPLLRFLKQTGAAINLMSPESGTGKTTVMRMIMSVYGHPTELIAKKSDTLNAKMQWLAIMCNLPYCVDEITNMKKEDFSELIYGMSQGKGKERMMAGGNELRVNETTWQTISLSTSNASFYEKLTSDFKNSPDGEMMRLIEYRVHDSDSISTEEGKEMFDHQLMDNYGHAGPIFIQYLLENMEEVLEGCMSIQSRLDRELRLTQRERFWSAAVAANITGGFIAKMLGLIDWDMNAIYRWACNMILTLREEVAPPATSASQTIGDFINRYIKNTLVINDKVDSRYVGTELRAVMEPTGELIIRYEPDTKMLFIVAKKLRDYCVQYQISYKDTVARLKSDGILIKSDLKRMSKGMKLNTTGVQVHFLDTSVKDFLDVEALLPEPEVGAVAEAVSGN
jgi:hypothetical protein